jgi:hypothetical protein
MKYLLFVLLLMIVLITAGCISGNQNTVAIYTPSITQAPASQSCVQITGETIKSSEKISPDQWDTTSTLTIKNNCGDVVEGKIVYTAYEKGDILYRGFSPQAVTSFTIMNSEEKTIDTKLPRNWYTEREEIAQQYRHSIVTSYDITIQIAQIGVDKPRAAVVSKYSGQMSGEPGAG